MYVLITFFVHAIRVVTISSRLVLRLGLKAGNENFCHAIES